MEIIFACGFFSCSSLVPDKRTRFAPNPITPSLNFTTATATALYSNPTQQSTTRRDRQHGSSRLRRHPGAHRCRGGLQARYALTFLTVLQQKITLTNCRLSGSRHRAGATSGWSSAAEHGIVTRRSKQCACPANAYSNKL